ncbi:permease [Mycoplasmatota bacterium]|nr:permease [Mycoplasmatota bacterium]
MSVFINSWFNDQILKMDWLSELIKLLVEKVFKLSVEDKVGAGVHFFIYDTIKIIILLSIMIFMISYIRSYFPPEKTKVMLEKVKGIRGNILGALLGVVTPFCSCSSVPIFIGFVSSGVNLGATFSFLIASPIINEAAFILLLSKFGWKVTLIYVIAGLLIGIIGGYIIDKFHLEKYVESFVYDIDAKETIVPDMSQKQRFHFASTETKSIFKRVYLWILIGIGIGAFMHGWLPDDYLVKVAGPENPLAVIIATIMAVPLYSNALSTLPLAEVLVDKGMAIGTSMSFVMATTALSLPEMMLLRRVIKSKLIWIFIVITTIGIIFMGYLFNVLELYNLI